MKRLASIAFTALAACAAISISGPETVKPSPFVEVVETIRGKWDWSARQRGLPHLLVLRQDGNIYPSFWGGNTGTGVLSIVAEDDLLAGVMHCRSIGGFSLKFHHVPPKHGMEDAIPGGVWMNAAKNLDLSARFTEFMDWTLVTDPLRARADTVVLDANFKGELEAMGRKAPIDGKATLSFSKKTNAFSFQCTTTVTGSTLGLAGTQAGPIKVKILAKSPAGQNKPKAVMTSEGLD